jgi:hypothetical protein
MSGMVLGQRHCAVSHGGLSSGIAAEAIEGGSSSQRCGGGGERGAECARGQSHCGRHVVIEGYSRR